MPDFFTQHMLRPGGPFKQAVVAAPGGVPAAPPQGAPPQGMPMDPSMMGGMPPQGAPPQGMPMDPSMMGGGAPQPTPADLFVEVQSLKQMVQQLMDAQMAMMQTMMPPGAGMPPMGPPPGAPPQGMPMDPSMMGLPAAPPPGMVAQASFEGDDDAASLVRAAMDFLR